MVATRQRPRLIRDETLDSDIQLSQDELDIGPSHVIAPPLKLQRFSLQDDPVVRWFYRPSSLALFAAAAGTVAVLAHNVDKLRLPERVHAHLGLWTACIALLVFCVLQCRDGPFRRPHPAVWRLVLGTNLIYLLALIYLYFQTKDFAREFMRFFDISLGVPIKEKDYGESCDFTVQNMANGLFDLFALAHALGWFGKAIILRDYWFCTILSVMYELVEYSFAHQLDNFKECWWDHWLLDVSCCNFIGTVLGMQACKYLQVSPHPWRGGRASVVARMAPYDFDEFSWRSVHSLRNYVSSVCLLACFLVAEADVFYLKNLLWLPADHPLITIRLAFFFLWALPAVREYYEYVTYVKKIKRMGAHVSLLLLTVVLELLCIFKWAEGEFKTPAPTYVKIGWSIFLLGIIAYPAVEFGIPYWTGRPIRDRDKELMMTPRLRANNGSARSSPNLKAVRSRNGTATPPHSASKRGRAASPRGRGRAT